MTGRPPGSTNQFVRKDTLPEGIEYKDTGCAEHPTCLDCPLATCVYDLPHGSRSRHLLDVWNRDQRIAQLRRQGVPIPELMRAFKLRERQVRRSIQTHDRPKPPDPWSIEEHPGKPVSEIGSIYRARKPRLRA